ncbi:TPA: restriction endonuclease subunit S [Vibrio antiquarius]|uniref:restriction endonuclease subunit S n=1 Tax=Vibrio diabolicus TaxID=50719 RepID=UPI0037527AB5
MSELPKGWVESSLIDLAKFIDYRGRTPKKTEEGIPLITAKNIKDGFINREPREFIAEADYDGWMTRGIPKVGDVLLTTEAPLGNVAQIDIEEKFALAQRAICFQFYESEVERFIYYYLRSPLFNQELGLNSTGSTVKGIKAATLKKLPVHIAPLAEQKRIVEKLDEVLAQVDTIKARLDGIPALLKRFRQSVLASAVSGKLTSQDVSTQSSLVGDPWSHEVKAPSHWNLYEFKQAVKITGGSQPPKSEFKAEYEEGLVRLIQIRDYKSDKFLVYIPLDKAKRFCTEKDIMIGRYGPPIFQILRGISGAYNVALMKAEPAIDDLDLEYLYRFLQNPKLFHYIDAGSDRTAGQAGVNKKFLESYPLFVPPLEEQKEIVRLVDQYFAFADTIEAQVKKAQARVDNLTQSILAKAFRGELVPQNDDDEPAEVLLERIAQARADAEALAKAAKKAGKKKA